MINASAAVQIILENTPLLAVESVPLLDSLGRVPSHDVIANQDLPPSDNSAMDGYAVASSDLRRASKQHPCTLNILGESSAGRVFTGKLKCGQGVRVMTGGLIPKGADAVVPIENVVEVGDGRVQFFASAKPGEHIRERGEDVRRGEIAVRSGIQLTPASLGVLAALGHARVRVRRKPRVSILATGNELVGIAEKPGRGQIRSSSSYALAGYIEKAGGIPRLLGIAPDTKSRLRKEIKTGLSSDVLLITGGVSVGKYDLVKEVLSGLGVEIKFWRVNIKPGKPLLFGRWRKVLLFGLPGNPVSTSVTFLQFVRPALLRMCGCENVQPMRFSALLEHDFSKSDGKRHYVRGLAAQRKRELHVVAIGSQSSGAMSSMARANCLMIVPEDITTLHKGDRVEIEFL